MVDPTLDDPGKFGEPVVTTEALKKAAKGTAAVDEEPYTDSWGRFYSSYTPVFDSKGNVAGIVVVDFSAKWYDDQIFKETGSIIIYSMVSVILGVTLVFLSTIKLRKQLKSINTDIS